MNFPDEVMYSLVEPIGADPVFFEHGEVIKNGNELFTPGYSFFLNLKICDSGKAEPLMYSGN